MNGLETNQMCSSAVVLVTSMYCITIESAFCSTIESAEYTTANSLQSGQSARRIIFYNIVFPFFMRKNKRFPLVGYILVIIMIVCFHPLFSTFRRPCYFVLNSKSSICPPCPSFRTQQFNRQCNLRVSQRNVLRSGIPIPRLVSSLRANRLNGPRRNRPNNHRCDRVTNRQGSHPCNQLHNRLGLCKKR